MAGGRRGAHPAFDRPGPGRREPDLGRHVFGRGVPHRRRRKDLGAAELRRALRLPAGGPALSRIRPVRALHRHGAGRIGPPLPAEPLRHVSQRRRRPELGVDRERPAVELRLSGGGAPAGSGAALPRAAQRRRPRPLHAGREGGGVGDARRRRDLGRQALGPAAGERLFQRAAAGAGCRPAGARGRLFRHRLGRGLRQPRRGRELGADRRAPAGDLLGRDAGDRAVSAAAATREEPAPAVVRLAPLLVTLFPAADRVVELRVSSVAEMVDALEARWPGMRDRICDSRPAIRRHINVFVDGRRAKLDAPLRAGADVFILTAVSGG
ncbi:MAG: hypothetical protein DI565_08660 [Ancylobacter novellus]|uniref:MoaD/ThiS family protein n=1 Tax=Ancylobacter novellus TaxID=921 RepID=A0A2W5MRI0_ANCNO|nr:MAG: hypothetical protein DI565_08660 [Ancylobacter novellus]